jgi:hypothetical protein
LNERFEVASALKAVAPSFEDLWFAALQTWLPFEPRTLLVIGFASREQAVFVEPIAIAMPKIFPVVSPIRSGNRLSTKRQSQEFKAPLGKLVKVHLLEILVSHPGTCIFEVLLLEQPIAHQQCGADQPWVTCE